jgi:hypothetical protein
MSAQCSFFCCLLSLLVRRMGEQFSTVVNLKPTAIATKLSHLHHTKSFIILKTISLTRNLRTSCHISRYVHSHEVGNGVLFICCTKYRPSESQHKQCWKVYISQRTSSYKNVNHAIEKYSYYRIRISAIGCMNHHISSDIL